MTRTPPSPRVLFGCHTSSAIAPRHAERALGGPLTTPAHGQRNASPSLLRGPLLPCSRAFQRRLGLQRGDERSRGPVRSRGALLSRGRALVHCVVASSCLAFCALACGAGADDDPEQRAVPLFSWDEVAGKPRGPRPFFSFFTTSERGLFSLEAGEHAPAPDPVNGFGGNLGGIEGADEICGALAQRSNPGDTKVWRAFLSTSGAFGSPRQDAIDRIGDGPWYDFEGRKLADDREGLLPNPEADGRPRGADPQLAAMFTGENGERMREDTSVDNHDVLTGSDRVGRLFDDGEGGVVATCEDWTSNTRRGRPGRATGAGGQVPVGHSWPRSNTEGRHWISEHTVNGCEPGVAISGGTSAPTGDYRVGAAGGYGGFYCFALNAVPPEPSTAL